MAEKLSPLDWKEQWVERMGLIVALSGTARFDMLATFKQDMLVLSVHEREELKECLRQRFAPSNADTVERQHA